MNRLRFYYDAVAACWAIENLDGGGGRVLANRVKLDVDARAQADGAFHCEGVIGTSDLTSIGASNARMGEAHIRRVTPLPEGFLNEACMLEWCVVFDERSGYWTVYRQDGVQAMVTAKEIELGCQGISSGKTFHCQAELLVDGATFQTGMAHEPEFGVRLRKLIVFDQEVKIPPILMKGAVKKPG